MATITAANPWTALSGLDTAAMAKTGPNVEVVHDILLDNIKTNGLPELRQFIQLMADGYGIGFNQARSLLMTFMQLEMSRPSPSRENVTTF